MARTERDEGALTVTLPKLVKAQAQKRITIKT